MMVVNLDDNLQVSMSLSLLLKTKKLLLQAVITLISDNLST